MNDVPVIFYEQVASQFWPFETLLAARSLRGLLGRVISSAYAKKCLHYIWVTNGQLEIERDYNCGEQLVSIETQSANYFWYTAIFVSANSQKYMTNSKATERVLSTTKGKNVVLCLQTSNISEEIAKCVDSIRLVFDLQVETKITSDVLTVVRSLVEKNTLNEFLIAKDIEIEDETAQLLVDLLKQKQFHRMFLPEKCSAALKTIIASWRENSEEMVGKMIYCTEGFSELQLPSTLPLRPPCSTALKTIITSWRQNLREIVGKIIYWRDGFPESTESSTEFAFEECSEEEERKAERAYPFAGYWPRITTKLVLRNQNGRAVYWFWRPSDQLESVFLFV